MAGPADEYAAIVAAGMAERRATSSWQPVAPRTLVLAEVRRPRTAAQLAPDERWCLDAIFVTEARVRGLLEDPERRVKVTRIVEGADAHVGLVFAWNYGVSYAFDAAILFADILLVPQALGADLWFVTGEGPRLSTSPAS